MGSSRSYRHAATTTKTIAEAEAVRMTYQTVNPSTGKLLRTVAPRSDRQLAAGATLLMGGHRIIPEVVNRTPIRVASLDAAA